MEKQKTGCTSEKVQKIETDNPASIGNIAGDQ